MKKYVNHRLVALFVLVVAAMLILAGCPDEKDESVSIDERITAFMADVNTGNYSTLQQHIHPSAEQYAQSAAVAAWDPSPFSAGKTYTLGTRAQVDNIVSAPINGGVYNGETATFTMLEHGSKIWKIRGLTIGDSFELKSLY